MSSLHPYSFVSTVMLVLWDTEDYRLSARVMCTLCVQCGDYILLCSLYVMFILATSSICDCVHFKAKWASMWDVNRRHLRINVEQFQSIFIHDDFATIVCFTCTCCNFNWSSCSLWCANKYKTTAMFLVFTFILMLVFYHATDWKLLLGVVLGIIGFCCPFSIDGCFGAAIEM